MRLAEVISDGVHPVGGYTPPPCDHVEGWRRILGSVIWERCGPDDGAVISGCSWPSVQFQLSDPDGWRVVAHNGVIGRGRGAARGRRRRVWRNRAGAVSGRPRPRLRGVGDLARPLGPWRLSGRGRRWRYGGLGMAACAGRCYSRPRLSAAVRAGPLPMVIPAGAGIRWPPLRWLWPGRPIRWRCRLGGGRGVSAGGRGGGRVRCPRCRPDPG